MRNLTNLLNKKKLDSSAQRYVDYSKEKTFEGFNRNIRNDRIMQGVSIWASYYRTNPQRFVKEYLGLDLKWFQEILLYAMMVFSFFMFIASRGLGKTYLTALFCCVRCILYPGTKVVIVAGQKSQAIEVIEKISKELMPKSQNLRLEIEKVTLNKQDAGIDFYNGSYIKTVTANDGARGARSNLLICDEFRLIDKEILDNVLRKFNAAPRQPGYLSNPKYLDLQEDNKEIYLTSAWLKSHWSWQHLKTYVSSMILGKDYCICSLPYQMAVKEGLLKKTAVENTMQEKTFDPISFAIEMECKWFGGVKDAYFDLEEIEFRRTLDVPIYPSDICKMIGLSVTRKQLGEIRILSIDIALMGGKKNDATAMAVMQLIPNTNNQYKRNVIYMETMEGGHSELQAIRIKQLYKDF
ncbi:MAG: terminase large subunit domain-containing protein [Peptoanaerobacter stomatis]|uniref:terminase large subunit domain-containing protein n=1 Tax=Peptoanaerobacter stomatis TaxID=796937 RepID=UPI003F9FB94D